MIGIIFAILSALFYALGNLFSKRLLKYIDSFNGALLTVIWQGIFLLPFIILNGVSTPKLDDIILILIIIFFGITAFIFLLKSFVKLTVSETLIIANIYPLLLIFLSPVDVLDILGILLIFFAVILVVAQRIRNYRLLWMPFVTAIGWGVYVYGLGALTSQGYSVLDAVFFLEGGMAFCSLMVLLFKKQSFTFFHKAFLPGFFTVLGVLSLTYSFNYLTIAVASSINTSQVFVASIVGAIMFKEELSFKHFLALVFIVAGVILFNFN